MVTREFFDAETFMTIEASVSADGPYTVFCHVSTDEVTGVKVLEMEIKYHGELVRRALCNETEAPIMLLRAINDHQAESQQ